jgi:hypothetical protein
VVKRIGLLVAGASHDLLMDFQRKMVAADTAEMKRTIQRTLQPLGANVVRKTAQGMMDFSPHREGGFLRIMRFPTNLPVRRYK